MSRMGIYLEEEDRFEFKWENKKSSGTAMCHRIEYAGGDTCWLHGPNNNADGTRSFIERHEIRRLDDLPVEVLFKIVGYLNGEIDRLQASQRYVKSIASHKIEKESA